MEDTVITNAGMETTTEAAPVDAGQDVSIAELLGVEQQQEPAQTVNENGVGGQQQEARPDQKDIGEAFARESKRLEAKYRREYEQKMQADPAYVFGNQMLRYIAQSRGLSLEDAAAFAQAQYVQAIAQTEGISPNVAQMLFRQQQPAPAPAGEQAFNAEARAQEIRAEIAGMELPEGFDFSEAVKDESFAQMLIDYPTAAAVRIYHAEKQAREAPAAVAEKLRARAAIPQPMKPQQPVTPKIDFHAMSTEEFAKVEARVKAELAKGNRVKF